MSSMIDTLEVRQRIASDHALLRSLSRALVAMSQACQHDEKQRQVIRVILSQLCCEVERHFRFEEEVILPLMREMDAWGPARAEQLCAVHEQHRAVLVALAEDADSGDRNIDDLAEELVWFFERFEREMAAEEQCLLDAEVIGAEPIIDQIDG